jgi:hypothetical protein
MKSRDFHESAINVADNKDVCSMLIESLYSCGDNADSVRRRL